MKTRNLEVVRVQGERIRQTLEQVSWMKGTPTREIRVYDHTKRGIALDPQADHAFEVLVELPKGRTHVQEAFSVSAIADAEENWHWFINTWMYNREEEEDKDEMDAAIIYEQQKFIEILLYLMPDINITLDDNDTTNYNLNGSWGVEEEGFNIKSSSLYLLD